MSTFDSKKTRLQELLKEIVDGKLQLPDFQRGWVWDDEHIRSLLVSIGRAFPVGAVMLLETGGDAKFKMRPVEGVDPEDVEGARIERLILDGQQRLTSLTQVLMLKRPVQTRDSKGRALERHYYIDIERALENPEALDEAIFGVDADRKLKENFGRDVKLDLSTPALEQDAFCFPCDQILNSDDWENGLMARQPSRMARYMEFRKTVLGEFRNYDVPVIELKKSNRKEAVCLVFEKVNTGGVPLSVFELVTATYAADGVNLRDEWFGSRLEKVEGIQPTLAKQRLLREVAPTDFLQGLTLLWSFDRRQKDFAAGRVGKQAAGVTAKREAVLSLPLAAYKEWRDPLAGGFRNAAKFLRRESFFAPRDLPYRTQLVPLAAVLTLLGERWLEQRVSEKLSRWYWCGVLGELYGGAVETRFALDVEELMAWIGGAPAEPSTVRDAGFQPERLETLRTRNSAAYKGISVLVQRGGAQDFFWKTTIRDLDETDWDENKLDIHHIFPKDWCTKNGIPPARFNSILNKTPISYKANRMIGGRAPSDYLRQLESHKSVAVNQAGMDGILRTHLIDPAALRRDDFEAFVAARRAALIEKVEQAIGKKVVEGGESVAEDVADGDD